MSACRTASGRLRRGEPASTLGAAVLGAGIVLLLSEVLRPHALAVSGVGLVPERRAGEAQPAWFAWVYWLSLVGLAGYVLATAL